MPDGDSPIRPLFEVAQQRNAPVRLGLDQVAQDVFDHQLAAAVGIRGRQREVFGDRHRGRIAVHGRRGAEHERLDAEFRHRLEQHDTAGHVVVVIAQRLGHRLADGFQAGEVDHGIDLVGGKSRFHRRAVADVGLDQFKGLAGNLLNALLHRALGIREVVDHDHVVPGILQLDDGVGTDIAHAARNQNLHCRHSL
jgi:hypothetical protein